MDDTKAHIISAQKAEEALKRTPPPAAPERMGEAEFARIASELETEMCAPPCDCGLCDTLVRPIYAEARRARETERLLRLDLDSFVKINREKDAEVAEWSLKYAAEVVRANKAEESLKTALTAAARTSKTILDERDALRVRAEKAEAEIARKDAVIAALLEQVRLTRERA